MINLNFNKLSWHLIKTSIWYIVVMLRTYFFYENCEKFKSAIVTLRFLQNNENLPSVT